MFGTGGCFFASLAYLAVSAEPHRLWFSLFEEAWKGQRLPVSGCTAQVYVRYRGRAVSGTQPWVCVTTIMAKDELIEIDLQLVAAHSMIGSGEPLLEIANGPIRQRHH